MSDEAFVSMEHCVWSAPNVYNDICALERLYGDDSNTTKLFREILEIPNVLPSLLVQDLEARDMTQFDLEEMVSYYSYMTKVLCDRTIPVEAVDIDHELNLVR
jgi:hypothetical protein